MGGPSLVLEDTHAHSTRASHRAGAHPQSSPRHPNQLLRRPSPDTYFALNLPRLGWAFARLPPAEPFILLLAAAWRPGPGIRAELQPGWLSPGARGSPPAASTAVVAGRRARWPPRPVPEAPRALSLGREGAGWSWQSVRLCLSPAEPWCYALQGPSHASLRYTRLGRGASSGEPRERERAEKEGRNQEARNWLYWREWILSAQGTRGEENCI